MKTAKEIKAELKKQGFDIKNALESSLRRFKIALDGDSQVEFV